MRFLKRVNDRGNLTIPTEVREAIGLETGDIVEFEVVGIVHKSSKANTLSVPTMPGMD